MSAPDTVSPMPPPRMDCEQRLVQRYRWAGAAAAAIMGKNKHWGSESTNAADDDPLAWWTLTELIATGGPKL